MTLKKLTDLVKFKHINEGKESCPYCRKTNVTKTASVHLDNKYKVRVSCDDCSAIWTEVYQMMDLIEDNVT